MTRSLISASMTMSVCHRKIRLALETPNVSTLQVLLNVRVQKDTSWTSLDGVAKISTSAWKEVMPFARMEFAPTCKEAFSALAIKDSPCQPMEILALISMNAPSSPTLVVMERVSTPLDPIDAGAITDSA